MLTLLICGLFAANIVDEVVSVKFPSNWKKCPKKGNEECLKASVEGAIKSLKNGNKKFGIIPLDPLHFDRMDLSPGSNSPVNVNLTLYNGDLYGSGAIDIQSIKVDWDNYYIEFEYTEEDSGQLIGDYTIDGKVLVLPVQGKGKANFTFEGYRGKVTMKGSELIKNGEKYFNIDEATYEISPQKSYLHLSNLFNGVPNLGDNMNKFMNENSDMIINEMKGMISNAFGGGVKILANNFFHKIPMNQLYTE